MVKAAHDRQYRMSQATMDQAAATAFWKNGYHVAPNLVSAEQCAFLRQCMDVSQRTGQMRTSDNRVYAGPNNQYAPIPGQKLLEALTPTISTVVGKELLPSYAFWRIYEHGAVLNKHKDRAACEVSVTIALAAEPAGEAWPIGVTDLHGQDQTVALTAGSGLLYQGSEVPHWRAGLVGERQYQMFLHYVVADGPFAEFAFDAGRIRPDAFG